MDLLILFYRTDIKFNSRPATDPMRDPQALNITEGFGEALTTALDVMGLNLPNNMTPVENNVSEQVIYNTPNLLFECSIERVLFVCFINFTFLEDSR